MKKITMADVANELNVSKTTVSRALNGKSDISEEMKTKIIAKCDELGYTINHNAQSLSSKKNKIIGILANDVMNSKGEFFYKEIYTNIVIELERQGYTSILKIVSKEEEKKLICPDFVRRQMVDGVIVLGEVSKSYLGLISDYGQTAVLVDFDFGNLKYDSIVTNNITSVTSVTKKLINRGYESIAFVGNEQLSTSIYERLWAYRMEMNKYNLNIDQVIDKEEHYAEPEFNLEQLTADVFICNNDYTAYRLIEFFKDNDISVPTDKQVIGFDNTFYSEISRPQISTCDVNRMRMASEAIRLLFERIAEPDKSIVNLSLNAEFVEKESTRR